ncbi:MAG: hypothetical protein K2X93_28175, partial [Candidatus Obscuribacterales bacterium]|nr:hypothetical protein [Candidatus Obscuribacterales bacterium]
SFAWAPDSQKLLISQRKAISISDLENKTDSQLPTDDGECYWSLPVWSPNGDLVAAVANLPYKLRSSNRIKIWDARSRICRRSIDVASGIGTLRWSKDGQTFLYSEPGSIKVIDTASGDTTKTLKTDECVSFGYSPKGGYLAFRDRDRLHILDEPNRYKDNLVVF